MPLPTILSAPYLKRSLLQNRSVLEVGFPKTLLSIQGLGFGILGHPKTIFYRKVGFGFGGRSVKMGNCLESWAGAVQQGKKEQEELQEEQKPDGFEKGCIRVKILLTKEELEWLLLQLKEKGGRKNLEDFLVEIERGRGRTEGWKPSLESIMECPEVQKVEMDCR